MRTRYLIAFCQLLAATACASFQEESVTTERAKVDSDDVFYATLEQSGAPDATKVYADEDLKVLWNKNDHISIFNRCTYGYEYTFKGVTGDAAGAFVKEEDDDEFVTGNPLEKIYAVYPYQQDNKINNSGKLSINWPTIQTYKPDSFGIGSNVMVSVTTDNLLRFRNVGGYLALKLYGDNVSVTSITLRGNNGENISGKATVVASSDEEPTISFEASAQDLIRLECTSPVPIGNTAEDATVFWLVVPPTQFTQGFNITVRTSDGGIFVKSTDTNYSIERNTLCRMAAVEVVPSNIVPFKDASFKTYCIAHFDQDGDGEISMDEAEQVTAIHLTGSTQGGTDDGIETLFDIVHFQNLIELWACGLDLTSLDIRQNPNLQQLICYSNTQPLSLKLASSSLTNLYCHDNELEELDLSECPEITYVSCLGRLDENEPGSDRQYTPYGTLKRLNVSNCKKLVRLICCSNGDNLTSVIGLEDCESLENFTGFYNDFRELDFSGNPKLERLYLAGNIHLASLDVTHCPELNWMSLWDSRQLTSVDLSQNTKLDELWAYRLSNAFLGDNTSIRLLNVWLPAEGFDLSALPNLEYLGIWNFESLDLSQNANLNTLWMEPTGVTAINILYPPSLNKLTIGDACTVESLDISGNSYLTEYNSAGCSNLKTLYVSPLQQIEGVTVNRSDEYINPETQIVEVVANP